MDDNLGAGGGWRGMGGRKQAPVDHNGGGGEGGGLAGGGQSHMNSPRREQAAGDPPNSVGEGGEAKGGSLAVGQESMKSLTYLSDTMLAWEIDEIMDDDLYRTKVKKIPSKFQSVDEFFDIHSNLLVEETRGSLKSSMLNIATSQIFHIISAQDCGLSAYYVDIDLEKARSDGDECHHIAKDYDIFLLSCHSPLDPQFSTSFCCLGMCIDIGRDTYYQKSFKVFVSGDRIKKIQPEELKLATFLTNIAVKMKISKVLSFDSKKKNAVIERVLKLDQGLNRKCASCDKLSRMRLPPHYSSEDNQTVESTISRLSCDHGTRTEIIWTPPGSRKNPMIIDIATELLHLKFRVFLCFPTINDILDFLEGINEPTHFHNFLVLNNINGLENRTIFEEVSLEHKCHELFCSLTLWKSWMKELGCLLDLSGYYHIRCPQPDECTRCSQTGLLQFSLISFTERFDIIVVLLRDCLMCILNRLPSGYILDCHADNARKLLDMMDQFDNLLHSNCLTDETVQAAFGLVGATIDDATGKELNKTRIYCVKLLDTLRTSLTLPRPESREEMEEFCMIHSPVVISTPDCASQLHGLKMELFQVLIVDGAGLISENELLIPLNLPLRHFVFLGDHQHLQPFVKSKLCEEIGYRTSLFQRLQPLSHKKHMLKEQHMMHPAISKFPNKHFYDGKILDGENVTSTATAYNEEFSELTYPHYAFLDIPATYSGEHIGKDTAAITMMIEILCKEMNTNRRLKIGVICLSSNQANSIRSQLRSKYQSHDKVNLEVKSIDNLRSQWFDLVILSTIVQDNTELQLVKDTNINVALTCSRHLYWIVGESDALMSSVGIWRKIITDAKKRNVFQRLDRKLLSKAAEQLAMHAGDCIDSNSSPMNGKMCKVGQEFTWVGRPHRSKYILARLRDQKGATDTCTFQASLGAMESLNKYQQACLDPPQDFRWSLSVDDLKRQYEKKVNEEFGNEENKQRGKQRLQTALDVLKDHGVKGTNEVDSEDRIFKIMSYSELDTKDATNTRDLLHNGSVMLCHFRLSRNYFYLKAGESYLFDKNKPYIHPKSRLPVSHAVITIGNGQQPMPPLDGIPRRRQHVVIQNSEGRRFGVDGIGRITRRSLTGLYRISI